METQTLKAEVREECGKGPARQLRMKGLIPAVFYGPGKTPQSLSVAPGALRKILSTPYGRNQVIELDLGATKELALVRDLAVHPVSRELLHVDFYSVSLDRPVRAKVPFSTKGRAIGVQKGGKLRVVFRELPVVAGPDKIPANIEVDVAHLDSMQSLRVKDIALVDGARIDLAEDRALVSVVSKEKEVAEEAAAPGAPAGKAAAKDDKKKK